MAAPSLSTEAGLAGAYPSSRFSQRERKLLESVKTYVDAQTAAQNALSELADVVIATPASGHLLIYDGTNSWDNKAMSGDATIASTGALTIANDAITTAKILNDAVTTAKILNSNVTTAKIADSNVTLAKLASGITPSHVVKFAGTFTTAGGDASETITVTGALATDIVAVTVKTVGGTPRTISAAAADTDAINVTLSGDPSTDHVLQYVVFRAAA